MKKRCGKCKTEKDIVQFSKDPYTKDGLCWSCKRCAAVALRERSLRDRTQYLVGTTRGASFYQAPSVGFPTFP